MADWLDRTQTFEAVPVFYVMERRYAVAGKIVDMFMDSGTNDASGAINLGDQGQREAATEFFLTLSEDILRQFAAAYTHPTLASMKTSLDRLISECRLKGRPDLCNALSGALENLDTITGYETGRTHHWRALNLPAFLWLLRLADKLIDNRVRNQSAKVTVVHDRQTEFERVLLGNVDTLHRQRPTHSSLLGVSPIDRLDLRNINRDGLSFEDSISRGEIQAADLLAGIVRRTFALLRNKASWASVDLADRRLMHPIVDTWNNDRSGVAFCSEALKNLGRSRWKDYSEYHTRNGYVQMPSRPENWRG